MKSTAQPGTGAGPEATPDDNRFATPAARSRWLEIQAQANATREASPRGRNVEAPHERCERWRFHFYAVEDLPQSQWGRKLSRTVTQRNARRDPMRFPPSLIFSGEDAVKAGATDEQLQALHELTPEETAVLKEREATEHAAAKIRINDKAQQSGARSIQITWASEIQPEPVPWLWVDVSASNTWVADASCNSPDPYEIDDIACVAKGRVWTPPEVETDGRIACGMVSIAAGREGTGKSSFGIWLSAKITRGTLPGAHYGTPKHVFYLATEDSWKYTLVPRLIAAGADMSKVGRVEVVVQEGATVTMSLPDDTELLTQKIIEHQVAVVVVDPLMSTLSSGLDANGSRDVRTALEPLAKMADQTGAAVVGIAHFNKATGLDALSRITGSGAFKDIARAVMVFANDGDERVFTQPKNSVGRYDLPSLNYEVRQAVVDTPSGKTATGLFAFTSVADRSVDDLLADERNRGRRKSKVTTFLVDYLSEHADPQTGEVEAADVIAAGEGEGFTRNQIRDARARSKDPEIDTRKEGFGDQARNLWSIKR